MLNIGGYGQLSLSTQYTPLHQEAIALQSARACLYLYLLTSNTKVLHVPIYICDSIFPAIKALDVEVKWYEIGVDLMPVRFPKLLRNERVLIVNYFGLLTSQIKTICESRQGVIVDNSQAYFSLPNKCDATIYSPRKFLAIPDGGLIFTDIELPKVDLEYNSIAHTKHLLVRASGDANAGYGFFVEAEKSLDDFIPQKMSYISKFLTRTVSLEQISLIRRNNYLFFYKKFLQINQLKLKLGEDDVPLCFPLKLDFDVNNICIELTGLGIYLPRYWKRDGMTGFGRELFNQTLFIPVDERLDERLREVLLNIIKLKITEENNEY